MKKIFVLLAVLILLTTALCGCNPAGDNEKTKSSEKSAASATENTQPTLNADGLEEGELPIVRPNDTKSNSSGSDKSSDSGDSSDGSSSDTPQKSSGKADSSSENEQSGSSTSGRDSGTQSGSGTENAPTLSPEVSDYIEEFGDELPFVPAN